MGKAATVLAMDIGGSHIKAGVFDLNGQGRSPIIKMPTPHPATPEVVLPVLLDVVRKLGGDYLAVGFPGVVRRGVTHNAINLHPAWNGFGLAAILQQETGRPVRMANDADVQGLGAIAGRGLEVVITLGTGFGSSLFFDGILVPNLELGQHPWRDNRTYEEWFGKAGLVTLGEADWRRELNRAIASLDVLFNYDMLYVGGGNGRLVSPPLPPRVEVIPNDAGLWGGVALWQRADGTGCDLGLH
ncbi:MAG: ROK family protein [Oscillatoriales cyanobacterium SM2_2_1]|nr:ROK family protein [Oscillatoriales cyanobacterium SM2_2_1]